MIFYEFDVKLDIRTGKGKIIHYLSRRERRRNVGGYVSPVIYTVEVDFSHIELTKPMEPLILEGDFTPRQGIMTRYAQKKVDPRYYTTIKVGENRFV